MKEKTELVKAWIKKAESDLIAARHLLTVKPNPLPDAACFHAHQCVEKYLKAYLTYNGIEFRKTHDLGELIGLATKIDKSFADLMEIGERLTDYAVDVRYPMSFEEPTIEDAEEAIGIAERMKKFILERLPIGKEK